jgi:hypothetical protein
MAIAVTSTGTRRHVIVLFAAVTGFATPLLAQQPPATLPVVEFNVEVLGNTLVDFTTKMDAYAALRRSLQEGLPELSVTDSPAEIHRAEQLLAQRIRKARAGTGRGDIFTEKTRHAFRQILRPVTNEATCELIHDDNPGEFPYAINSNYPKNKPRSTVPAAMLAVLPRLPEDVWYRFLDHDLILHDSRANVILDRIDNAIRCH